MSLDEKPNEITITEKTAFTLPFQVNEDIVKQLAAHFKLKKETKAALKESHEKLWLSIHKNYPYLNPNDNYSLTAEHIEIGIVVLELREPCDHKMPERLKELIDKITG